MKNQIKIVPDAEPNADGKWIDVSPDVFLGGSWYEVALALNPYIPDGWHLVQIGSPIEDAA